MTNIKILNKEDDRAELKKYLSNKRRRLTSGKFYKIVDKDGNVIPFIPNIFQLYYLRNKHNRNLILKARQLGFSTIIQLDYLDDALFNSNFSVGVVAQDRETASVIRKDKIELALSEIPEFVRGYREFDKSNAKEIRFSNKSSVYISNSFRGGTLQRLHISEYGKICAKTPLKAEEINTGALETVGINQQVTIESTAEGGEGHFFDLCEDSSKMYGKELSLLHRKFHFFPRRVENTYTLNHESIVVTQDYHTYFQKLEREHGIKLTLGQKKRYVIKANEKKEKMFREYPSHYKEAFFLAVAGAYYEKEINRAYVDGRVSKISYDDALDVYTCRDLGGANPNGSGDHTAIRFFQIYGREVRFIDYYECTGNSMLHIINQVIKKKPYTYAPPIVPHDIKVHEYTTGQSRRKTMEDERMTVEPVPKGSIARRINTTKQLFPYFFFDEAKCTPGLNKLKNYKRKRDQSKSIFIDVPDHNGASHPADSIGYGAEFISTIFEMASAPSEDENIGDMGHKL